MARSVVGLPRQKGACADMQSDLLKADPAPFKVRQELFGEMQAGGGRSHRAFVLRKEGLVIGAVLFVRFAAGRDVGRQGHLAALGNRLIQDGSVKGKGKSYLATLILL